MALNLGNVNFGVDANTKGLQKAVEQLNRFQRATDKVAKSQQTGATKTVNQMVKQESAIKKAFQQTLKLQNQLRKAGAPATEIARVSTAFKTLTGRMTSGALATKEFRRSQDAFAATMGRSSRAMQKFQNAAKTEKLNKFNTTMRNLESASVLAVGPLSGIGARVRSLGAIFGRTNLVMVGTIAGITATTVAFAKLAGNAIRAATVFEQANARFLAASGSQRIAADQMQFVIQTTRELGLRIEDGVKAFSRLTAATRGSGLSMKEVRKIFLGITTAAAALRLGADEVQGTFRALEQIMSKGTVQAEELRGQLGERLPGAFTIAAKAMGLVNDEAGSATQKLGEMLKAGEILATDFAPKFSRALLEMFSEEAKNNINSITGASNDLSNAWLLLGKATDEAISASKIWISVQQTLASTMDGTTAIIENFNALSNSSKVIQRETAAAFIKSTVAMEDFSKETEAVNKALAQEAIRRAFITDMADMTKELRAIPLDQKTTEIKRLAGELKTTDTTIKGLATAFAQLRKVEAEEAIAASEAVESVINRSKAFAKFAKEIKEVQTQIKELGKGVDAEFLDSFTIFEKILKKIPADKLADELGILAKQLGATEPTIKAVATAMANATLSADALIDKQSDLANTMKKSKKAFEGATRALLVLQESGRNLDLGEEEFKRFLAVGSKVRTLTEKLRLDGGLDEADVALIQDTAVALNKQFDALKKIAALKKEAKAEDKRKVFGEKLGAEFKLIQKQIDAIRIGPEALETFNAITKPVEQLRTRMEKIGESQANINIKTAEYKKLLGELKNAQDNMTQAGQQSANAIVNSLEDIILKTSSVKEALGELAKELLRVTLRALILDPILKSISSFFGGVFSGAAGASAGATSATAGGTFNIPAFQPPPVKTFASGGSFSVGGTGGIDSQLVAFRASPNEKVTVSKPGQTPQGGDGGGISITINAPGADAGTISRIREIVRVEMAPAIIKQATTNTIAAQNRPKFS